jgi:hypothetical protein
VASLKAFTVKGRQRMKKPYLALAALLGFAGYTAFTMLAIL